MSHWNLWIHYLFFIFWKAPGGTPWLLLLKSGPGGAFRTLVTTHQTAKNRNPKDQN
jgi:hypothetical protein